MSVDPLATPQDRDATYPRTAVFRFFRVLLRFLWVVILLGIIGAIAPNAWSLYQKTQGFNSFLDPNNLGSLFYIPQLTQLVGGDTTVLIGIGAGAGLLFLLLFIFGLRARGDARRERKVLRARRLSATASTTASATTLEPSVAAVAAEPAAHQEPVPLPVADPVPAAYTQPAAESSSVSYAASAGPSWSVFAPVSAPPEPASSAAPEPGAEPILPQAFPSTETPAESFTSDASPAEAAFALPEVERLPAPAYAAPEPARESSVRVEFAAPSPLEPPPAYGDSLTVAATPPEPKEMPSMSSNPPQNPPNEPTPSYDTPAAAPNWWATAPAATTTPPQVAAPPSYPSQPMYPTPSYPAPGYPQQLVYPAPGYPQQPGYPAPTYPPAPNYAQPPYAPHSPNYPTAPGAAPSKPISLQDFGRAAVASVPLLAGAVSVIGKITAPQQDETGISPAPFAARAAGWSQGAALTDRQLGDRIDGWADTVVGMAEVAPTMIQAFVNDLPAHFRPTVNALTTRLGVTGVSTLARGIDIPASPVAVARITQSIPAAFTALPRLILGAFGATIVGKQRDYLFAVTTPGAVVGVTITGAGRDLYIAWDLYLRRVWNEIVIGLLAMLAMLFGVFDAWVVNQISILVRTAALAASSSLSGYGSYGVPTTVALASGLPVSTLLLLFIVFTFVDFAVLFVFIAILGRLIKRDSLAFFRKKIDIFEENDIQSMALTVHKALGRAADAAGANQKFLREKRSFITGRANRAI